MTMDRIIGKYPGLLSIFLLCAAVFYPILARDEVLMEWEGDVGSNITISCNISAIGMEFTWQFEGNDVKSSDRFLIVNEYKNATDMHYTVSNLTVVKATRDDSGNYTCRTNDGKAKTKLVDLSFPGKIVEGSSSENITTLDSTKDVKQNATLTCVFEVYNASTVRWYKGADELPSQVPTEINSRQVVSTYMVKGTVEYNGVYSCQMDDTVTKAKLVKNMTVIVYGKPKIQIDKVIGIGSKRLFLNWTVQNYHSPISDYALAIGEDTLQYIQQHVGINNTSFVLEDLKKSTKYVVKIVVTTKYGNSSDTSSGFTLDEDPVFVPNISINGFSATSVTIGWAPPPEKIAHLIHYYLLEARKKDGGPPRSAFHSRDSRNLPYMFDNLDPHCVYIFKVKACQEYTGECGNWSEEMEAATLDGTPSKPVNVTAECNGTFLKVSWAQPEQPNAEIKGYTLELTGNATFKDRNGVRKLIALGPQSKFTANSSRQVRFDDLQPNTNYTVRLSAMTRTRRRGEEAVKHCATLPAPPDAPPRLRWRKFQVADTDTYLFKLHLSKVSERNGPICCYRIHMMKLVPDSKGWPSLRDLEIVRYEDAHAVDPANGAYITDIFTNENFPEPAEIIMGDNNSIYNKSDPIFHQENCKRCLYKPKRREPPPKPTVPLEEEFTTTDSDLDEEDRVRRSYSNYAGDFGDNEMMRDPRPLSLVDEDREREVSVKDGPLDSNSNYTLFVELIPGSPNDEPIYSDILNALMPASGPSVSAPSTGLELALQAVCGVAALLLLAMLVFCVMHTRRARKVPHAHLEMNPIQAAFMKMVGQIGGRQQLISTPPDMPPIAKEDLAVAYSERYADSCYGFQKEFELLQMLSEGFPDRTTHASEARENQPKNRYPDIKAYDQTRVKLSQIDGIAGSDYINANYVMGYKESKQFICAQGPTDTTVNDFWRMIWEHGLELIVMLTNLEEYSKVKCSKYWPDGGTRTFGGIVVHHVSEKRYSDYIVRELKISKQHTNSEGQPIVENNGIAKRNGECKSEASESVPTSPREMKDSSDIRIVKQYHFLMWKDFAAPEHPHTILKFIKRVNEAWLNMVGRPVVVHCSAGVGRTGTLVALDCLLEQLRATGHAAVFNTIAELRRQRNFLVQSQKQYVFVYRALVEYAHYGDTEIPASRLKSAIDRLRNTPEGADKCLMEHEFEKMYDPPVAELVKSCAAGQAEELRTRNRSADCLPYDRNRVMLTPIPGRDYSTYINASFVEAYDNSEGFIITQDPLPNTIFDFWRMVSEQSVSTIVMLSELGEGKCPRYWDDAAAQYEHMTVTYEDSESCPYYTRRTFRLTNNKSGHACVVRQLQYHGWPTAPGHVPEVTRGLAELADAAGPTTPDTAAAGPMLIHCHLGTERSALFVALCILIVQLRTERRVDVSAVARKVRDQRQHTIDTFLQYEFLHRAILNYAELHNLLEDS